MVLLLITKTKKNAKIYQILLLLKSSSKEQGFKNFAVQTFWGGDFLNIFLRFCGFEVHFLAKIFLIKKNVK